MSYSIRDYGGLYIKDIQPESKRSKLLGEAVKLRFQANRMLEHCEKLFTKAGGVENVLEAVHHACIWADTAGDHGLAALYLEDGNFAEGWQGYLNKRKLADKAEWLMYEDLWQPHQDKSTRSKNKKTLDFIGSRRWRRRFRSKHHQKADTAEEPRIWRPPRTSTGSSNSSSVLGCWDIGRYQDESITLAELCESFEELGCSLPCPELADTAAEANQV